MTFTGSFDTKSVLGDLLNSLVVSEQKSYFTSSFNAPESSQTTVVEGQLRPIYRGVVGGTYVYSIGSPPGGGATFITIIGYTE